MHKRMTLIKETEAAAPTSLRLSWDQNMNNQPA